MTETATLLEFPCAFPVKAMGRDVRGLVLSTEPTSREIDDLENRICDNICRHDPDQD